jgi:tripartite-type tricarboxylate transporter receptor subunit TctC
MKLSLPALMTSALLAWSSVAAPVQAQEYPVRPIRMVVPYAAGGGTDFVARAVSERLAASLDQPVVIDNRAGANGATGSDIVAKATPDGYTLLVGAAGTLVVAPHLGRLPFDPTKDLVPITNLGTSAFIVAVNPSLPVKTLAELVAFAKSQPGKVNYGSSGTGGSPHLATELFMSMAGVQMTHVPYKGLSLAITDLLGGHIQVLFVDVGLAVPFVKADKVRALAITGARRSEVLPTVPTVAEAGVPGYDARTWYGLFAPAGTPQPIVDKLAAAANNALESADMKAKLASQGLEAAGGTPVQFASFMRSESAKWAQVIKNANIKIE